MRLSAAFFLLPFAVLAQSPAPAPLQYPNKTAPPAVDQALRARVNEFFEYHVEGKFSKAYALVAEDTKEYYFATQKVTFKSFKIDGIRYSDDFQFAEVDLTGQRLWQPRPDFPVSIIAVPMHTTWKIEDGKWMWYDHARPTQLLPMGPSAPKAAEAHSSPGDGTPDLSAAAMQGRVAAILRQQQLSPLDKSEVVFSLNKSSSQEIVFHNVQPGDVKLYLDQSAKIPGVTAELDKSDLGAGQQAILKLHFDSKDAPAAPAVFTLRLVQEPLDRVFLISIKFAAPAP